MPDLSERRPTLAVVMRPIGDPDKCHYPVFRERAPRGYRQCSFWAQEKIAGKWYCHRHAKEVKP